MVEDDDDLRELFVELLQLDGWRAQGAADLVVARRKLAALRPDLLVLDLDLGGESSEPLLCELVGRPGAPATLLVSASIAARAVAATHGVTLVEKPFEAEVLLAHAEDALARTRSARSGARFARFDAGVPTSPRPSNDDRPH